MTTVVIDATVGGAGGGSRGGAGGTLSTPNGADGIFAVAGGGGGGPGGSGGSGGPADFSNGGGAGGAGGAGGTNGSSSLPGSSTTGVIGDPGIAGDPASIDGGDGGGGGAGGYGAAVLNSASPSDSLAASLTGGHGGKGGDGGPGPVQGGFGGNGGGGGGGLYYANSNATSQLTIGSGATLQGGVGGDGGLGGASGSEGLNSFGGDGGTGGDGLDVGSTGVTIDTSAAIAGGSGGAAGGFNGTRGRAGTDGANGAGIVGEGLTIINETGGKISGGGSGASQGNAITFLGGANTLTLNSASDSQLAGKIEIDGGTVTFNQPADRTVSNAILGAGGVIQDAANTLTLSGTNTYSGATVIEAGTLRAGSDHGLSSASAFAVANGAELDIGNGSTIGSLADSGGSGGTVEDCGTIAATLTTGGDNNSTSFSGTIEDGLHAVSLIKTGTGTFTLGGANTYTGDTTVNGGVLSISADDNLGSGGTLHLNNGTTLQATANFTLTHAIVVTGDPTYDVAAGTTLTISNQISGDGDVEKTGGGTLVLSNGTNNYTLGTVIHAGTLDVAAAGAAGGDHDISFGDGEQGTLRVENAALSGNALTNHIVNFGDGDVLDLPGLAFVPGSTTYNYTAGTLSVTAGGTTDTFTLANPVDTTFAVGKDASGGTEVIAVYHVTVADDPGTTSDGTTGGVGTLSPGAGQCTFRQRPSHRDRH